MKAFLEIDDVQYCVPIDPDDLRLKNTTGKTIPKGTHVFIYLEDPECYAKADRDLLPNDRWVPPEKA